MATLAAVGSLAFTGPFVTIGMHDLSRHRFDTATTTGTVTVGGACRRSDSTPPRADYSVGGRTYATTHGQTCLRVGEHVTVHYNPANPANADFMTTPFIDGVGAVATGGLLISAGAFITMVTFRPRGRWAHRGRWAPRGGGKRPHLP